MLIDRNEVIAPRDVSAIYGTYKKNSELEDVPTARPGSNSLSKANDYAATTTFQHPFRWKIANIPQGPLLIDVETGVKKKIVVQDFGVLKKLKETMEKLNSSDNWNKIFAEESKLLENFKKVIESFNSSDYEKKIIIEDSKLLEKLKEAMKELNLSANEKKIITEDSKLLKEIKETVERINSSDDEKKVITEDSELLKEIKETLERVNSLELPFADIREPKEKFSTPPQFDLAAGLLEFLEERSSTQATDEGSTDNTNNTFDSGDSADYNLLNIEA